MSQRLNHPDDAPPPRRPPDPRDPAQYEAAYAYIDRQVILRHRREGQPLLVDRDGVIVELDPRTVPLPAVPELPDA
jgi:hypothetical protein